MSAAALQALWDLYEKVAQREARLAELGAKKVTRALAEKHPELRPLVALFSECHELFGHEQAGIRATELRPGKDVGTSPLTGATTAAEQAAEESRRLNLGDL